MRLRPDQTVAVLLLPSGEKTDADRLSATSACPGRMGREFNIEPPAPIALCLGCKREAARVTLPGGHPFATLTSNVEECFPSCIDPYIELAGSGVRARR